MEVMNWNIKPSLVESKQSLTDLQAQLFPMRKKLDRGPASSEDKYTAKTLEGNWFERRTVHVPEPVVWITTYDADYKPRVNRTLNENRVLKWDNKLFLEGIAREKLLGEKEEYRNNMTTTFDLSYNILPKRVDRPKLRTYNARQRKWVPEQDLTISCGNLTGFGLKNTMRNEIYKNSDEGIAKCRWVSTYAEEIGKLVENNTERITKFNVKKVDFNVPDLKHFERKTSNEHCLLPYKGQETTNYKCNF